MKLEFDDQFYWLVGGALTLLIVSTLGGAMLAHTAKTDPERGTARNFNARIRAWWLMVAAFGLAITTGRVGPTLLFALISLLTLREFVTFTPTRQGDYRTLFWVFFVLLPLQYILLAMKCYTLCAIMIPVGAFLFVPLQSAVTGDCEHFMKRVAKIQWGLMLCVYGLSYIPALLGLDLAHEHGQNGKLLVYFVLVVEMSDVLQNVSGRVLGRHIIAPKVSSNKTWEGFVGGVLSTTLIGTGLWWATPFSPWQAAGMSLAVTLMAFAGKMVMLAVKRGWTQDHGGMVGGHGAIMDRIDSLCFAAPVFFHLVRYYFT